MSGERKTAIFALLVPVVILCAHLLVGSKETRLALLGLEGRLPYYASSYLWVLGLVFLSGIRFNPFVVAIIVGMAYAVFRIAELNASQFPLQWDSETIYEIPSPIWMYYPTKEWVFGAFSAFGQIVQLFFVAGLSHFLTGRWRVSKSGTKTAATAVATLCFAGLFSVFATSASAQDWRVQSLKLGAAHGAVQAPKGEHQFTEAYFRFEDRTGIYISCIIRNELTSPRVSTYLRIANGEPFSGPKTNFHAVFENGDELALGEFRYAGGGYHGPLDPKTLAMILSNFSVRVTNDTSAFDADFPLEGVLDAVKQIECMDFRN